MICCAHLAPTETPELDVFNTGNALEPHNGYTRAWEDFQSSVLGGDTTLDTSSLCKLCETVAQSILAQFNCGRCDFKDLDELFKTS